MRRVHREELLDLDGPARDEVAASLRQVAQVNRLFGGVRALRIHLAPLARPGRRARILDVGTGSGEVAGGLAAWALERGAEWEVVGVDLHPWFPSIAREWDGRIAARPVVADGFALPFPDRTFDAVVSTLTLHHFEHASAVRLTREMARVSAGLVIVNDLRRGLVPYLAARFLALTLWRGNRLTRHDGPLSILRAFVPEELEAIGEEGGLASARVYRHLPFRLVLVGGCGGATPGEGRA